MPTARFYSSKAVTDLKDVSDISARHSLPTIKPLRKDPLYNASNKYKLLDDTIGDGSTCVVKKCIRVKDNKKFAVKIIKIKKIPKYELQRYRQEISILTELKNAKYVATLVDHYWTKRELFIVMELYDKDTLFEFIQKKASIRNNKPEFKYNEYEIGYIFYQIIRGIHQCHKKSIVHRDLKLENILIKKTSKDIRIFIADFGLSSVGDNKMRTRCGSPNYIPPEFFKYRSYTSKCDWWSAGVILYIMLSGKYPFYSENKHALFAQIKRCDYNFKSPIWSTISNEAKDLLNNLLTPNVESRYSYLQVIDHPFMKKVIKHFS